MIPLKLKDVAAACSAEFSGDGEKKIYSVCTDTRKIEEGCLFIALKGENFDGNAFVEEALSKGAAAAVSSRDVDDDCVLKVQDTCKALSLIAGMYRRRFKIPVIALTGSVGKTTTKEMVHCVISSKYKTLKSLGNLNNQIGMPMTVFSIDETYEAAVFEMGMADFGEISNLSRVAAPTLGILTNIGVSHMETLGSRENILKAKMEILDGMENDAPVIVNADDEYLRDADFGDHEVIWYGIESEKCHIKAEDITSDGMYTDFTADFGGEKQKVHLPTIGIHNVYNALAALAAGVKYGISLSEGAVSLEKYEPSGMRQRVKKAGDITVIEDCYNASPDSMKAALSALSAFKAERKIAVLADMLELGAISEEAHRNVGKMAADFNIDMLFTFGKQAKFIAEGAESLKNVKSFEDKQELTESLLTCVRPGDCILFKGSRGMKLEEVINALYEGWNKK